MSCYCYQILLRVCVDYSIYMSLHEKKHKQSNQLTTALAKWLVPMWYHIELKVQLCDASFLLTKTFVIWKTSSAKVDEILLEQ